MLTETHISNADIQEVIRVLEKEYAERVRNGDDNIVALRHAIIAFGEGDRVVIGESK